MWHNPIGPWIGPKVPKLGDMWQPLVLPHHHADYNMTHVISFSYYVCCMDVDVIHMDTDISSTDVESSCVDWARLTKN
jgi:hypothetical protein